MNTHEEILIILDNIQDEIKMIDKISSYIIELIGNKVRDKEGLIFTKYFNDFDKVYSSNDTIYENLIFELNNDHFNIKYRVDYKNSYEYEDRIFKNIKDSQLDITFTEDTTDINRIYKNYKYVSHILYQIFKKQYNK